jgi:hypothetical protein
MIAPQELIGVAILIVIGFALIAVAPDREKRSESLTAIAK